MNEPVDVRLLSLLKIWIVFILFWVGFVLGKTPRKYNSAFMVVGFIFVIAIGLILLGAIFGSALL